MEISLDNMQVSFMTAGIKTASDSVRIQAAESLCERLQRYFK